MDWKYNSVWNYIPLKTTIYRSKDLIGVGSVNLYLVVNPWVSGRACFDHWVGRLDGRCDVTSYCWHASKYFYLYLFWYIIWVRI